MSLTIYTAPGSSTGAACGDALSASDNWCVGFSRRYTVGVWVGNFDGAPMTNVSGVTGAAPIWLAVMNYLNANSLEIKRAMPSNVARVADPRDPSQTELFLAGTETSGAALKPAATRRAHIAYPRDGEILSLDPDIPPASQRVRFESEPENKLYRWSLSNAKKNAAISATWWQPTPGKFTLALLDANGKQLDAIQFEVRGATNNSESVPPR